MNKILTAASAAGAAMLVFASCNNDSKGNSYVTTTTIPAYNLFIPINGTDEPFVGSASYAFTVTYPEATIGVTTNNMAYPGGTTANFSTVPMTIAAKNALVNDRQREIIYFGTENASQSGMDVSNFKGMLTQAVFPPYTSNESKVEIPGYTWMIPGQTTHYAFMQYRIGGYWYVRTFWPDLTYRGQTVTSYPQDPGTPFASTTIAYRVVMKMKDNSITDKADVIFYNAKFAPQAPEITVVLKDLDLTFTADGYTVSGTNLVPSVLEAGALQENPRYKFDNFRAVVNGQQLTGISISYRVAGVYTGSFTGSCVVE